MVAFLVVVPILVMIVIFEAGRVWSQMSTTRRQAKYSLRAILDAARRVFLGALPELAAAASVTALVSGILTTIRW